MITIVDYGMGNLGSIVNMAKRIGARIDIQSNAKEISKAKKIILPGVGSFDAAIKKINNSGIKEVLDEKALHQKIPILGICLGMQILTYGSEEGSLPGLGWIPAQTYAFRKHVSSNFKVPHMGWNTVMVSAPNQLTSGLDNLDEIRFYFVHSYFVKCQDEKNSFLKTKFELEYDSGIQNENIFGVQFHPEKSHSYGMKILKNFSEL